MRLLKRTESLKTKLHAFIKKSIQITADLGFSIGFQGDIQLVLYFRKDVLKTERRFNSCYLIF